MNNYNSSLNTAISNPVCYDDGMESLVSAFGKIDEKDPDYWGSSEIEHIRSHIKVHYIKEQRNYCCYCRRPMLSEHNGLWDVEHVISRSQKPAFMFTPMNLAVSCKDCNIAKGSKNVLVNKTRVTFPDKSGDYLIVHPHFDDYYEHIYRKDVIYLPRKNSSKGKYTINVCDLLRFVEKYADLPRTKDDSYAIEAETLLSELK